MSKESLLHSIGLDELMALSGGSPDVRVAVIDGPVDTGHADFVGGQWLAAADGGGACRRADSLACGHGTFVAGVLGADRKGSAPGICPACTFLLRPIFCEDTDFNRCPVVTTADLAEALLEVIERGAQLVNLSVGLKDSGGFFAAPLRRVYDHARERGVLIVGAAGNQGIGQVNALFEHEWIIPVGAAGPDGRPIEASNLEAAGLLAPGLDVSSTAPGGGYCRMSGTSVAAPFVTGTLALLKALFPAAAADELRAAVLGPRRQGAGPPAAPPLLDARRAYRNLLDLYPIQPRAKRTMEFQQTAYEDGMPAPAGAPAAPSQAEGGRASAESGLVPQSCGCGGSDPSQCSCKRKGVAPMGQGGGYVYALGVIRPVFPDEGLQKEFEFAARSLGFGEQDYYRVFSHKEQGSNFQKYLYIAEQVVWVMDIAETDTYVVQPRSHYELGELIASLQPDPSSVENYLSLLIGPLGPVSSPARSGGLQLPIVLCNQLFYFTMGSFAKQLLGNNGLQYESIRMVIKAIELKPNAGDTDERRALNYIAFRYPDIYTQDLMRSGSARTASGDCGYSLLAIKTEGEGGTGGRRLVNVIFDYQQNDSGMPKSLYTQVDVTGQFPFITKKLQDYIATP